MEGNAQGSMHGSTSCQQDKERSPKVVGSIGVGLQDLMENDRLNMRVTLGASSTYLREDISGANRMYAPSTSPAVLFGIVAQSKIGEGTTGGPVERKFLTKKINVNVDHRIIKVLGFEKWLDLVRNGPVGIIEGVTVGGEALHRYSLKQGRQHCVCLYTEKEFKQLVIESHYTCRYHFYNDRRRWSWCLYCQQEFKDKNGLSYHRQKDQCSAWKECEGKSGALLKMYPTFSPSDKKIVKTILKEAGLKFPARPEHRPWAPRQEIVSEDHCTTKYKKRKRVYLQGSSSSSANSEPKLSVTVDTVVEGSSFLMEASDRGTDEAHTDIGAQNVQPEDTSTQPRLRSGNTSFKRLKKQVESESSVDPKRKILYEEDAPPRYYLRFRQQGRTLSSLQPVHADQHGRLSCAAVCSASNLQQSKNSEDPQTEEHGSPVHDEEINTLGSTEFSNDGHNGGSRDTRDAVYAAAQKQAECICLADLPEIGPPPLILKVPGLFYLLSESPVQIVDRALLKIPADCMTALNQLEVNGVLSEKIMAAVGPWIHWKRAQLVSPWIF